MQLVLLGKIEVEPEDAPAFASVVQPLMDETRREAGCLHYTFARDLTAPERFWLSERWVDAAALDAHLRSPHIAAFRDKMASLRVKSFSVTRYDASNEVVLR